MIRHRKALPYSKRLVPCVGRTLNVLTGSGGWDRAASETWCHGVKVVMPLGSDPEGYDWSPARSFTGSIIWAFGKSEPLSVIDDIAGHLMQFHHLVLFVDFTRRPAIIRFVDEQGEVLS